MNKSVVWPARRTADGSILEQQVQHNRAELEKAFVEPYLSSVPKFLSEKFRGFVDIAEGPLADWIPTIPPPSVSVSMAKSLRTFSMLSLGLSKIRLSEMRHRDN